MNFVLGTATTFRAFFAKFATPVDYTPAGGTLASVKMFVRGLRADDLFAEAMQQDSVAVMDAAEFVAATGQATPRRLDRVTVSGSHMRVEAWRGAPNTGAPTFFKVLLRGGQQ